MSDPKENTYAELIMDNPMLDESPEEFEKLLSRAPWRTGTAKIYSFPEKLKAKGE